MLGCRADGLRSLRERWTVWTERATILRGREGVNPHRPQRKASLTPQAQPTLYRLQSKQIQQADASKGLVPYSKVLFSSRSFKLQKLERAHVVTFHRATVQIAFGASLQPQCEPSWADARRPRS